MTKASTGSKNASPMPCTQACTCDWLTSSTQGMRYTPLTPSRSPRWTVSMRTNPACPLGLGADTNLRELVMLAIEQTGADSTMSFADIVRAALHQMVLSGTSSAENVALLFGMHERTLRKRLTAEGTSLQELVSQTRFDLAKQLLENTELALWEIASALHYADAAVFSRAFRGWSKTNPREWRARSGRKAAPRADELGRGALSRLA